MQHRELCPGSCGSRRRGRLGESGHEHAAESLYCAPETVTAFLINQLYSNTKYKSRKAKLLVAARGQGAAGEAVGHTAVVMGGQAEGGECAVQ